MKPGSLSRVLSLCSPPSVRSDRARRVCRSCQSSSPALQPNRNAPSPVLASPRFPSGTPPLRSNAPSPAIPLPRPHVSAAANESMLATALSNSAAKSSDPWDFDLLASNVPPRSSGATKTRPTHDDPFDLGLDTPSVSLSAMPAATTGDGLAVNSSDDFDLLGAFSQPANAKPPTPAPSPRHARLDPQATSSVSPASRPRPREATAATNRSVVSPPPELLLKLTAELGFDLPAANRALIETFDRTGQFKLEDAVEVLMNGGGGDSGVPDAVAARASHEQAAGDLARGPRSRDEDEWGEEEHVRIGRRRSWEFEAEDSPSPSMLQNDKLRQHQVEQQHERRRGGGGGRGGGGTTPRRRVDGTGGPATTTTTTTEKGAGEIDQTAKVLQDQAQEVLAQAQKIGFSMFKSANAYWGAGKDALAKKLDEQRKAARVAAGLPPGTGTTTSPAEDPAMAVGKREHSSANGRPKWWKEGMPLEDDDADASETSRDGKGKEPARSTGFKDSDGEEGPESVLPQRPTRKLQPRESPIASASESSPGSVAPAEYRSPFRRAKPAASDPSALEGDLLSEASAAQSRQPEPRPAPAKPSRSTPPPRVPPSRPTAPRRPPVSVSPAALSRALAHKATGNDHFKLGRFSDASQAYSLALEALPPGWIGRIVLLNNRAQSRLKSGEEKLAAGDCAEALEILLLGPYPEGGKIDTGALERESGELAHEVRQIGGGSVDLRDQLGKSLGRRAKALEVTEKWQLGLRDWEQVRSLGDDIVTKGAGGNKLVGDGIARCRKMLGPTPRAPAADPAVAVPRATGSVPTSTNRVRPAAAMRKPEVQGSGEAVKALQASQAAQSAEEDLRLELKDQVDGRITSWKASKETNLRALIASLDQVLWPELGWKTVGMHELITENQLKVRYVRAIAKVHPDKVSLMTPRSLTSLHAVDQFPSHLPALSSSMLETRRLSRE